MFDPLFQSLVAFTTEFIGYKFFCALIIIITNNFNCSV